MNVAAEAAAPGARPVSPRPAAEGDLPAVCRIERDSFPDPWSERDFRAVLDSPHAIFLVAVDESSGRVAGYAIALTVMDEAEILNLAVDQAHRRDGVGSRLIDAAILEAEGRGAASTFLEVRESNLAARRLYESRGFEAIARRRGYYRKPSEDALVLRRATQR